MAMNLRLVVVVCSAVFTIGTLVQNMVVIDLPMMTRAMELAGAPTADAAVFMSGLRAVGWAFVVGNAFGMLALFGWRWLYWLVVVVNAGQAAGVVLAPFGIGPIPPEVFQATVEVHGPAGLLPSLVTDGGAALLVVALVTLRRRWRPAAAIKPAQDATTARRPTASAPPAASADRPGSSGRRG
jgi:hypothetical protein